MSIAVEFDYQRPETLADAVELLGRFGDDARILAGGTDLVPWLRDDLVEPAVLVDVKHIPGLGGLVAEGGTLTIGALATFTDLLGSDAVEAGWPLLAEAAATVASPGIRHRATVVGNICSAVPSCDAGPALLVMDAVVHVAGPEGVRRIPIADWFLGPKQTALARGELATHVTVPAPPAGNGSSYARLSRYAGEDLAQASVAAMACPDRTYRVAFGAVAPTPVRAHRIEAVLNGTQPAHGDIVAAQRLVVQEVAPITDMRATKEYRLRMSAIFLGRALATAVARREGA